MAARLLLRGEAAPRVRRLVAQLDRLDLGQAVPQLRRLRHLLGHWGVIQRGCKGERSPGATGELAQAGRRGQCTRVRVWQRSTGAAWPASPSHLTPPPPPGSGLAHGRCAAHHRHTQGKSLGAGPGPSAPRAQPTCLAAARHVDAVHVAVSQGHLGHRVARLGGKGVVHQGGGDVGRDQPAGQTGGQRRVGERQVPVPPERQPGAQHRQIGCACEDQRECQPHRLPKNPPRGSAVGRWSQPAKLCNSTGR